MWIEWHLIWIESCLIWFESCLMWFESRLMFFSDTPAKQVVHSAMFPVKRATSHLNWVTSHMIWVMSHVHEWYACRTRRLPHDVSYKISHESRDISHEFTQISCELSPIAYELSHVSCDLSHVWCSWAAYLPNEAFIARSLRLCLIQQIFVHPYLHIIWIESCLEWMSHVSYEMSHVSDEWVVSHMK